MTLFDYWRSSAAYRVRIGLNLLGLTVQHIPVSLLHAEQRSPENLARNPQGLVPTLLIDGLTLTQSLAILEYLDETRGPIFLPADPATRARTRALAYVIAMEIAPVCNLSVRQHVARLSEGRTSADDWQRHYNTQGLTAFETLLGDGNTRCCIGESVTLADICLVPQIYNARRIGLDMSAFPRIDRIMAHLDAIPEITAAHPDRHIPPT